MHKTRLLTRYPLKFAIKDITETVKSLFSRCLIRTNKVNLIDDPAELRHRTSICITNSFPSPSTSKIYGKELRYSETL